MFDPTTDPILPKCGGALGDQLDIAASVIGAPDPAAALGAITYVLTVRNVSKVDATGVTLTNTLPSSVSFVDATPAPFSRVGFDQLFRIAAVPAGASTWVVIHAVAPSTLGPFVDKANVSIAGDRNTANDSASASIEVKPDACFVTPTNLVSRWRGNGNAYDDVGGHDGQVHGAFSFAPGRVDKAFHVDGSDGFVTVADAPDLRPKEITLSAWVRPNSFRYSYFDVVAAKGASIILGLQPRRAIRLHGRHVHAGARACHAAGPVVSLDRYV